MSGQKKRMFKMFISNLTQTISLLSENITSKLLEDKWILLYYYSSVGRKASAASADNPFSL